MTGESKSQDWRIHMTAEEAESLAVFVDAREVFQDRVRDMTGRIGQIRNRCVVRARRGKP